MFFPNTKKEIDLFLAVVLGGSMLGLLSGPIIYVYSLYEKNQGKKFYQTIKSNPQVYIYDTFYPALNDAMYVTNEADYNNLVGFYKKIEQRKSDSAYILFPIRYLSFNYPMYTLNDHLKDSQVIEIVDMDTSTYEYKKCVVYKGTVHKKAPPDSLVADFNKYWKSRDSLVQPYMKR